MMIHLNNLMPDDFKIGTKTKPPGSYGGCMVLGALAFHPEEFKAGVDLFGVANWLRTLRSIPPYWESGRKGKPDYNSETNA
jgi:Prolyl oligopeptidase family